MKSAGLDIGSRTTKLVVLDDSRTSRAKVVSTTYDPLGVCRDLLEGLEYDRITATGYGRHLFKENFECLMISEIKAVGLGAASIFPNVGAVLDIGGQDIKAVSLDGDGKIKKFEMNDKCAAGTGRFLEVMATALAFSMEEFTEAAFRAPKAEKLSSMCTVFAESEVISKVARGAARDEIALGLHMSVTDRAVSMMGRLYSEGDIMFAGGVAKNRCMCRLVSAGLGNALHIPPNPQVVTALGCALFGASASARGCP